MAFVNSLFSIGNYNQPIQYYLDDSLYFELDSSQTKMANFYIQLNEAALKDSVTLSAPTNLNFF